MVALLVLLVSAANAATIDAPPKAYIEAAQGTKHPELLLSIAYVESRYTLGAVGALGELGPLQIRPEYLPAVRGAKTIKDHFKLADAYLSKLAKECAFLGEAWFICYNLGPAKAKLLYANAVLDKARTFSYYQKVKGAYIGIEKTTNVRGSNPPNKSQICVPKNNRKSCRLEKRRQPARPVYTRRQPNLCEQRNKRRGTVTHSVARSCTCY